LILLDTEALIWIDQDDDRLGAESRALISSALDQQELCVSTISFWEIGWLVKKKRIDMQIGISAWRNELLDAGIQEIPVNGLIGGAGEADNVEEYLATAGVAISDVASTLSSPRDELIASAPHLLVSLIVATAIRLDSTVVTSDRVLLDWSGNVKTHDAGR
jgi:PIN domain nuclease of toxin-antitoxin system